MKPLTSDSAMNEPIDATLYTPDFAQVWAELRPETEKTQRDNWRLDPANLVWDSEGEVRLT